MLYLFHGTNTQKTRQRAHVLIDSLLLKKKDASLFALDSENFNEEKIKELLSSRGLFEQKYIIFLDQLLSDKEMKKIVMDYVEEMKESSHIFVMLENKIDKKSLTKLEKNAEKVLLFDLENEDKKGFKPAKYPSPTEGFNIFNIADAFAVKDRKRLWMLLVEAKMHNIAPEEIHGILMWSVRTMLLAESVRSAEEAGLKPFVFGKAQKNAKNFSKKELAKKSSKLISIYHDSRRGEIDFGLSLEMFVLKG